MLPHEAFRCVARVAGHLFDVPIVLIDFSTADGQQQVCRGPVAPSEAAVLLTLISEHLPPDTPLIIEDLRTHPAFATSPLVTGAAGLRFLAVAPLQVPGGLLCVADTVPHLLTEEKRQLLYDLGTLLAQEIAHQQPNSKEYAMQHTLQRRDAILEAAGFAAEQFLRTPTWEDCVQPVLERLGRATGVSRIYLFENHTDADGALLASQRNEYVAPGIDPQIDNPELQNVPYEAGGFGRWARLFRHGQPVYGLVHEFPEAEADFLTVQGIHALAVVPISVGDEWLGFIGFDDCIQPRVWTEPEIDALKVVAGTLGAAMQRRAIENAVRTSERRYRSLFKEASDGILVGRLKDEKGGFLEANEQACALSGYTHDELLALAPEDLFLTDSPRAYARVIHALGLGVSLQLECALRCKDGSDVPIEVSVTMIEEDLVQAIVRDITVRKQAEQQLIEAKEKAESIARFKSTLLATMSHEFRTPLTAVLGFADILLENLQEADHQEMALSIREAGRRLLDTLNHILDLAQIESGAYILDPQSIDVVTKARAVLETFRRQAAYRGLALQFDAPPTAKAHLDPPALERLLSNLLSNAVKFTSEGIVIVRLTDQPDALEIQVQDTGIGIDAAFLPHIFRAFMQESTGLSRNHDGTGLGLTVTQRLVELMGGTISVASKKNAGSVFTVVLPKSA